MGYFISFGVVFAYKKERESWLDTFGLAIVISLFSWINIGLIVGDFHKKHLETAASWVILPNSFINVISN